MKKELQLAAVSYRQQRVHEKEEKERILLSADHREPLPANRGDNHAKTFGEFIEKWLPYHVRKKCLSPNTYDSYRSNLDNHILPVFGNIIMSTITAEDMHKVRLTQNNYQLVAENSGQSPEVLMSNYNEAREIEKRALAAMVERSFYPEIAVSTPQASSIMEVLNQNPDLASQILKNLLLQTAYAQPNTTVTG